MAEYKSCCSKQSFSGLTITVLFRTNKQSFSGLPIIPKTINQLCLLQTEKPHAKHNLYRWTTRQTPCQTQLFQTDKQTNPMPNITFSGGQTDKPHAKHYFFRRTNRQTPCQTLLFQTDKQTNPMPNITFSDGQTDKHKLLTQQSYKPSVKQEPNTIS